MPVFQAHREADAVGGDAAFRFLRRRNAGATLIVCLALWRTKTENKGPTLKVLRSAWWKSFDVSIVNEPSDTIANEAFGCIRLILTV